MNSIFPVSVEWSVLRWEARSHGTFGYGVGIRPERHSQFSGPTLRIFAEFLKVLLWGFDDCVFLTEKKLKPHKAWKLEEFPVEHSTKKEEKKNSHVDQPGTTINPQRHWKQREKVLLQTTQRNVLLHQILHTENKVKQNFFKLALKTHC